MICLNCKKEIVDGEIFCPFCFSPISAPISISPKEEANVETNKQATINNVNNNNAIEINNNNIVQKEVAINSVEEVNKNINNDVRKEDNSKKVKKRRIIFILINVLISLVLCFGNYFLFSKLVNRKVVNISDYCPEIENNIKKIEAITEEENVLDTLILTNSGDVYAFYYSATSLSSSKYCKRISELSLTSDMKYKSNRIYIKKSNNEIKNYYYSFDNYKNNYNIILLEGYDKSDFQFPDKEYGRYFYFNNKVHYIIKKNIYETNKNGENDKKIFNGDDIFDSEIMYISTKYINQNNINLIYFSSKNYIYTFSENLNYIGKTEKLYNDKASDIVAISDNYNGKFIYLRNGNVKMHIDDGISEKIEYMFENNLKFSLGIIAFIIIFDTINYLFIYKNQYTSFKDGYLKFIVIYGIICLISMIFTGNFVRIILIPFCAPILGFPLFCVYYLIKKSIWNFADKLQLNKQIQFYFLYRTIYLKIFLTFFLPAIICYLIEF